MVDKARLIEFVEQGQVEILRFAGTLNAAERSASGKADDWAARDILAHVAFWKQRSAERLAYARQQQVLSDQLDETSMNAKIFAQYSTSPWSEIEDLLFRSHRMLMEQVNALTGEELTVPGYFPTLGSAAAWRNIAGNGYLHPMAHITPEYIRRGDTAYADELKDREMRLVSSLDDSPEWQATNQYNLACYYALRGDRESALANLEPSLRLNPGLIEWSQQDTDLISLHQDAEFIAILARVKPA